MAISPTTPPRPASKEFKRLCAFKGWSKNSDQLRGARSAFKRALVAQFNVSYGTDVDNLSGWHALLGHIGISPLPGNVAACKKTVQGLFVNIVDLVDARRDPKKLVPQFDSEKALSKYTKKHGKFFAKDIAKADGMLKFLLRQILQPTGRKA